MNRSSFRAILLLLAMGVVGCDSAAIEPIDTSPQACIPRFDFAQCVAIASPDPDDFPPGVVEASELAAARLSARRIQEHVNQGLHSKADEPEELPDGLATLYGSAILHTYQHSSVVRDSLYGLFRLTTKHYPLVEFLQLRIFSSLPIYHELVATGRTGILEADSILDVNGFELMDFAEHRGEAWFEFATSRWKNYRPVEIRLTNIPQIAEATAAGSERCFAGPCLDIVAEIEITGVRLAYVLEWDGCPVGCIKERTWEYFVDQDGLVRELDVRGQSFP